MEWKMGMKKSFDWKILIEERKRKKEKKEENKIEYFVKLAARFKALDSKHLLSYFREKLKFFL